MVPRILLAKKQNSHTESSDTLPSSDRFTQTHVVTRGYSAATRTRGYTTIRVINFVPSTNNQPTNYAVSCEL